MLLACSLVPLSLAFLAPFRAEPAPAAKLVRPAIAADAFAVPKEGLSIAVKKDERGRVQDPMSLYELVLEFERVTGQHSIVAADTRGTLEKSSCNLTHDLQVAPQDVYFVFETLLITNDLLMTYLSTSEPRLFTIQSLQGNQRQQLRSNARYVPVGELNAWVRHPAVLVNTFVELEDTDVRTLSNSMRTMFTDANTQQIIPVGNSNALIITGFAPTVHSLIEMLKVTNESSRKANEARAKAEAAAPKVEKEASKK